MLKKLSILFILFLCSCTSIHLPSYVQDVYPYKKKLYASFEEALEITTKTLKEHGWEVTDKVDPVIFERNKIYDNAEGKQILLFTKVRPESMIIVSKYTEINVYLRSVERNITDIEMRFLSVTSIPFKSFYKYRKDKDIEKILNEIEKKITVQ